MKIKYRFIYFFASFFAYVALAFLDFFVLRYLLEMISTNYLVHTIMMLICLIIINPIIVYYLINYLPIKPKLKKLEKTAITEK